MGAALEVITGRVTNAGGVFVACTPNSGDSFSVKNFDNPDQAMLLDMWALGATAGFARIRSPRLHDNTQAMRFKFTAANPVPLLPDYVQQTLYAQDALIVEISDAGAETDLMSFLNYYSNMPGSGARLYDWPTIKSRIRNILSQEVSLVSGATLGDYSGGVAINSTMTGLKANTDYAILGYDTDTSVCTIGIRGPDTGNFRIGGPGTSTRVETRDWFIRLSEMNQVPVIPVFNSANQGATIVDVAHNANAVTTICDLVLAELAM